MKKIQTIKIGRKQFYNVEMLSKMLSIPVETVRAYIRRNRLRAIKVGKRYLVSEENLQRFLDGEK
jgi:excisionase family DNA binding protein